MRENYQSVFIEILKKAAPVNLNLADEVGQLLGISADSTYRRLRCETELTLNETILLCRHFDIPLEALNAESPDVVSFKINKLGDTASSFSGYLDGLLRDLNNILKSEGGKLHYAAEDLPLFYVFFFPELARFKMIYWTKSILNVAECQGYKVEDMQLPEDWQAKAIAVSELFCRVPTVEIWNEDSIKSTSQQIRFYWEAGFFKEQETLIKVMREFKSMIEMVQRQAEMGYKFNPWKGSYSQATYLLYISDLMIGNNCVYFSAGEKRSSYIGYNSFNYMRTTNNHFNDQVQRWLQNRIAKSTLVSGMSEKIRNQFFKEQLKRIEQLQSTLLSD